MCLIQTCILHVYNMRDVVEYVMTLDMQTTAFISQVQLYFHLA